MACSNRDLLGRDKPEPEQKEVPSPVRIEWAWPGTEINLIKTALDNFERLPFTIEIYIILSFNFSLNKIPLKLCKSCISIQSRSQTWPGICSQTRQGFSLCSLSGLSLRGRSQFLVLLNQSEQDKEPLSALALDCLCQTGLTPWSVSWPFHRTIMLFLLLCKIMFCWGHIKIASFSNRQTAISALELPMIKIFSCCYKQLLLALIYVSTFNTT